MLHEAIETDHLKHCLAQVKGGISPQEGLALARQAARTTLGCIVEIGSYKGKSSLAMAMGVRGLAPGKRPRIYAIDPHREFVGQFGGQFGPVDRGDFYTLMLEHAAFNEVALINLPAEQVAAGWGEPVGFLFIDGDHRYAAVFEDFVRWYPHVVPGGIIALDDSVQAGAGSKRLCDELVGAGIERVGVVGKITFLRKPIDDAVRLWPMPQTHLVLAETPVLSGGLMRFVRLARAAAETGRRTSFAFVQPPGDGRFQGFEALSLPDAMERSWEATSVPGAGFSPGFVKALSEIRNFKTGCRVQHVLNDRSRHDAFLRVNRAFAPDVVIFNTQAWEPGSFTDFSARRFHTVVGAVDSVAFAPVPRLDPGDGVFRVGLQAKAHGHVPALLANLPEAVRLRVLGTVPPEARVAGERVEYVGAQGDADLPKGFYAGLDAVLHLDVNAGWANIAAEAMACGIPVIATRAGTEGFAEDGETAIVLAAPDAAEVAAAVARLTGDTALRTRLAAAARERIGAFSWSAYAGQMGAAIREDGLFHYLACPELGMFGKWPVGARIAGLEEVFATISGETVLDVGGAEGVITLTALEHGARLVHMNELEESRVLMARKLTAAHADRVEIAQGSLTPWGRFVEKTRWLLPRYDTVLYLAVHQHLHGAERQRALAGLIERCGGRMVIRMPDDLFEQEGLAEVLAGAGLQPVSQRPGVLPGQGALRIWKRAEVK
ncbi:MAG: class I SAM-dependent methyltransferase [Rhodobacteraceae bacterium]|nr:class I SAM-dependent methyltransferase [Paracoccaceae bacterium]